MKDILPALVGAVFASSGFWAFIQWLINRNDGTRKELQGIREQIAMLSEKVDNNAAVLARTHILRFDDEVLNGVVHSKEYYIQQLEDIDFYEDYCLKHPAFRNSHAVIAAEHIRDTYKKLLDQRAFGKENAS